MKTNDKLRDRTGRISGRKVRLAKDTAKLRALEERPQQMTVTSA